MKIRWFIVFIAIIVLIAGGIFFFNQNKNTESSNLESQNITNKIEIQNFQFSPKTLTIRVGESVTWENSDSVSHTVTSDSGGELSSAVLAKGQTYSHKFNNAGTFNYHCSIHTSMTGVIIVQ